MSDCKFRLKNHGADFDEIWSGHYAIIGYPNLTFFKFPAISYTNMTGAQSREFGVSLATFNIGSCNYILLWSR
jgi:hypothetical protein